MNIRYFLFVFTLLLINIVSIAQPTITSYPDRIYGDSLHAPFYYGVASAEPKTDRVMIWTKIAEPVTNTANISWEISENEDMSNIINSGSFTVDSSTHWTGKVDVTGLQANKYYYYRFTDSDGNHSCIGRTKTAPSGDNEQVRFAVASCSSIYSGYFNAYKKIAQRNDIDLMIHLGDYIYEFVDTDEQVRVPSPWIYHEAGGVRPVTKNEWRFIHEYHLLDPDFRHARQMHPWVVIWDNHDIKTDNNGSFQVSVEAFHEYFPFRDNDTSNLDVIYKKFEYGNLVDLYMIDIWRFRNLDSLSNNETSILGLNQYNWFTNELENSNAKWRVIGNQKIMSGWYYNQSLSFLPIPNDGPVFSASTWDGYMEEREKLFDFMAQKEIKNNVVLSGDMHISMIMELTKDPTDASIYNPTTGQGAVGVEFLPTSISRGNFDEQGVPSFLIPTAENLSLQFNPHHQFSEFTKHGYGIIDVKKDSTTAEFWFVDILSVTNSETFDRAFVTKDKTNHWERYQVREPTSPLSSAGFLSQEKLAKPLFNLYPNPASNITHIEIISDTPYLANILIRDITGKIVFENQYNSSDFINIDTSLFPNGVYIISVFDEGNKISEQKKLIKM